MNAQVFSRDVLDLLGILQRRSVRYLVVGGAAAIQYGSARLTGDIDLFFEPSQANAEALWSALREFWDGPVPELASWEELAEPGIILQFGMPPNRIDLLNRIDGVEFGECWEGRLDLSLPSGDVSITVHYIGIGQLIRNKEASGRGKDLDDLRFLRESAGRGTRPL
jgi:hypothetical protein